MFAWGELSALWIVCPSYLTLLITCLSTIKYRIGINRYISYVIYFNHCKLHQSFEKVLSIVRDLFSGSPKEALRWQTWQVWSQWIMQSCYEICWNPYLCDTNVWGNRWENRLGNGNHIHQPFPVYKIHESKSTQKTCYWVWYAHIKKIK